MHSLPVDVALALCWIPFAAARLAVPRRPTSTAWLVSATLLISFAHQPLTLALVYGDKRNFDLRRRTFTWSPLLFAAAVLATQHVSLTALAVVAGLWNAEHTLMQRYGIMRIHGRKAGQQNAPLDKALLFSWLALAFVWIAADGRTPGHIAQTGLRGKNRRGLDLLADLQPIARILLPLAAIVAVTLTVRWLRDETRRGRQRQPGQALLHRVDRGAVPDDSRQSRRRLPRIRRLTRHRVLHHRAPQRRPQVRERRRRRRRSGRLRTATASDDRLLRASTSGSSSVHCRCSTGTAAPRRTPSSSSRSAGCTCSTTASSGNARAPVRAACSADLQGRRSSVPRPFRRRCRR